MWIHLRDSPTGMASRTSKVCRCCIMTLHWLTPCTPYTTVQSFIVHCVHTLTFTVPKTDQNPKRKDVSEGSSDCLKCNTRTCQHAERRVPEVLKVSGRTSGMYIMEVENTLKEIQKSF